MLIGLSKPQCFLTRYPLAKAALQCLIFRHSLSSLTQAFFSSFDGSFLFVTAIQRRFSLKVPSVEYCYDPKNLRTVAIFFEEIAAAAAPMSLA